VQIQDYYLKLKFNDGAKCVRALHRLFIVGTMLYHTKVKGRSRAHNYPKIQLTHMLVMQHWIDSGHCTYEMMKTNMGIFNEESSEIGFSILARCVNNDPTKADFDHMNRIYSLLPVYREIKDDVLNDNNVKTSLSWRHKIKPESEEVQTAELFFKKTIRQIVRGTHRSYDGTTAGFKNAAGAALHQVTDSEVPLVYLPAEAIQEKMTKMFSDIKEDMNGFFVQQCADIWPESKTDMGFQEGDVVGQHVVVPQRPVVDQGSAEDGLDSSEDEDGSSDAKQDSASDSDSGSSESDSQQPDGASQHGINQSWVAVDRDNVVLGPRQRSPTKKFLPSKRRVVWD
jgi:hypothetical protein